MQRKRCNWPMSKPITVLLWSTTVNSILLMQLLFSRVWPLWPHGLSWDFPKKNTGAGYCFLFQAIFPRFPIEPRSPALAGSVFTAQPQGKPEISVYKAYWRSDWIYTHQPLFLPAILLSEIVIGYLALKIFPECTFSIKAQFSLSCLICSISTWNIYFWSLAQLFQGRKRSINGFRSYLKQNLTCSSLHNTNSI